VLSTLVDTLAREQVARSGVAGAVVGVWVPGQLDFLRSYGVADMEAQTPMRVGHRFRIGSLTKTFTASAVLILVDRGALRLEDRLSDFVRDVPYGDKITVRHLLNMTAGTYDYTEDPRLCGPTPLATFGLDEVLRALRRNAPRFMPGAVGRWQYSNSNYILLGAIIEHAAGVPAHEFLQGEIFDVLGLAATSYPDGPQLPPSAARGYLPASAGKPHSDVSNVDPSSAGTAGAIISTVPDLRRWLNALVSGALLTGPSRKEQLTFVTSHSGACYGAGLVDLDGYIGHDGGIWGYGAAMFQHPSTGVMIVIATNTSGTFATNTFAKLSALISSSSA
jgi:D-alanyl-D-alanine carboxypeptidase